MFDNPYHSFTLWGNTTITIVAFGAMIYFAWKAMNHAEYREPLLAITLVFLGNFVRVAPWTWARFHADACEYESESVVCLYQTGIITMMPYFTMLSAMAIVVGAVLFARWIEEDSYFGMLMWVISIFTVSFMVPVWAS